VGEVAPSSPIAVVAARLATHRLNKDKFYRHVKTTKNRTAFLEFCRYLRTIYPSDVQISIVLDNFSQHLSTKVDTLVGD
jgi:hypothetical protein